MPQDKLNRDLVVCEWCKAHNFAYATFCIECGYQFGEGEGEDVEAAAVRPGEIPPHEHPAHSTASPRGRPLWLTPGKLRLLEAALGLLVLLSVVGYAVFNWQQSSAQDSAYHDGEAAEQSNNWDRAVQSFGKAGGLQDAAARMQAAQQKVDRRNVLYGQAVAAGDRGDWPGEIAAIQQMQAVQPSYLDSDARLADARARTLAAGLDGLVYLVDRGPSAGLYVRDATGHASLFPGSDAHSIVRAAGPAGSVLVYDRPVLPSDLCAGQASSYSRVPVLARLDADKVASVRVLPCLDGAGTGVFAEHGLWWFSPSSSAGPASANSIVYYQDNDPALPAVRVNDPARGERVLAVEPGGDHVALARERLLPQGDGTVSLLYAAQADGSGQQPLRALHGEVEQASISEDGRWLLCVMRNSGRDLESSAMALSIPDARAGGIATSKAIYAQRIDWTQVGNGQQLPEIDAIFLPSSDGHSTAAVATTLHGQESLWIYDLDTGKTLYNSGTRSGRSQPFGLQPAGSSPDGALLAFRGQKDRQAAVNVLQLGPGGVGRWSQLQVPAFPEQQVQVRFAPRAGYAVITVASGTDGPRQAPLLYAAHVNDDGSLAPPTLSARIHWPHVDGASSVALAPPGYVLAYVTPSDQLYATLIDGSQSMPVADNVGGVWNLAETASLVGR